MVVFCQKVLHSFVRINRSYSTLLIIIELVFLFYFLFVAVLWKLYFYIYLVYINWLILSVCRFLQTFYVNSCYLHQWDWFTLFFFSNLMTFSCLIAVAETTRIMNRNGEETKHWRIEKYITKTKTSIAHVSRYKKNWVNLMVGQLRLSS